MSHSETHYGTKQGDFLGQEKLILGHNDMNYGTEEGDFLGQEKLKLHGGRDDSILSAKLIRIALETSSF